MRRRWFNDDGVSLMRLLQVVVVLAWLVVATILGFSLYGVYRLVWG
jgi:hypothetical protein